MSSHPAWWKPCSLNSEFAGSDTESEKWMLLEYARLSAKTGLLSQHWGVEGSGRLSAGGPERGWDVLAVHPRRGALKLRASCRHSVVWREKQGQGASGLSGKPEAGPLLSAFCFSWKDLPTRKPPVRPRGDNDAGSHLNPGSSSLELSSGRRGPHPPERGPSAGLRPCVSTPKHERLGIQTRRDGDCIWAHDSLWFSCPQVSSRRCSGRRRPGLA